MGFSGKPSKGCLPCRQKRTKCDLALPSCTQCIRKSRACYGYRNEQDLVFRNETGLVIRKVKRKATVGSDQDARDEELLSKLQLSALLQHPSRRATLQDEAIMHWMGNFNERFHTNALKAGFEYMQPVFRNDLARGGPAAEVIYACGLVALGNTKNSPELLRLARVKQVKAIRLLNEQLQDPAQALSDSSVLTFLLLSSFENIMCEGDMGTRMNASQTHLKGAATLLALCLVKSEPLPEDLLAYIEDEKYLVTDFEVTFFQFMSRILKLRHKQKRTGVVDAEMFDEAKSLLKFHQDWDVAFPAWGLPTSCWGLPSEDPRREKNDATTLGKDKAHRIVWISMSWIFLETACIVIYEVLIMYYRTQQQLEPSPSTEEALAHARKEQLKISQVIMDGVDYYFNHFKSSQATTRNIGAHMLMLPLSMLLSISTASRDVYAWIARTANALAEVFGMRQAKLVADFLKSTARNPISTFASHSAPSVSYTGSPDRVAQTAEAGVVDDSGPADGSG